MNMRNILLGGVVILEVLSVALFLTGSDTAVAAGTLGVGLTLLVVALSTGRTPRRP